jgi:hypothetical protein
MRSGTPGLCNVSIRSRHGTWRDSRTSHATQCGMTPTNPTLTKIPRSSPFGRAKPRGATNTWVTPHDVARLISTVALEKVTSDVADLKFYIKKFKK